MIHTILRSFAVAVATTLVAAAASAQMNPGDQSHWSLDFRARMEQHAAPPIEVHMAGEWTSTISAVHAGKYDAQLQLADLRFLGDAAQKTPAAALSDFKTRLSRPFWATYRSDGGLIAMHFYGDSKPADRNLLQMIASEVQLVRPAAARTSWTAQERDGAGEYSALYVMPQAGKILKRKLKYVYTDGVAGAPADAVRVAVDQSEVTFSLNADQRVASVDGSNRVHMDLSTNTSEQMSALTEFHLANLRTDRATDLVGSLDRALPQLVSSAIVTQAPDPAAMRAEADERLLKGYATDELLAAAFVKDGGTVASPDRLTALFRRRPEAAGMAAAMLLKDGSQRTVTNAMGAAGSVSAVDALSRMAHNKLLAEKLRVDAIVAFVEMQHPSTDAMRVPRDLVQDPSPAVASAARMISGALARAGRSEHPAEAEAIDTSLVALYRGAHDAHAKSQVLSALGNSAGPSVVPVIESALTDPHPPVRSAAARALRLTDGVKTDRLLAGVITADRDAAVRADAIFATRFRKPMPAPLADALLKAASSDSVDYVRSDALAVLRLHPAASARIPQTLERIAKADADPGIRREAREALASFSPVTLSSAVLAHP